MRVARAMFARSRRTGTQPAAVSHTLGRLTLAAALGLMIAAFPYRHDYCSAAREITLVLLTRSNHPALAAGLGLRAAGGQRRHAQPSGDPVAPQPTPNRSAAAALTPPHLCNLAGPCAETQQRHARIPRVERMRTGHWPGG